MKKGLAILLVLSLLASMLVPFPVLATAGNTLPESVTVGGTGGITTLGSAGDILGGSLPTAANLHFTIDPRNLLDVELHAVIDPDARNTAVNFGDNNVLQAWSTSSIETLLTVALQVNATGATAVLTEADITTGDVKAANNVLMWMEPSASYRTASDAPFVGLGQVVPYGEQAVPVQFRLQERPHDIIKTGVSDGVVSVGLNPAADAPAQFGTAFSFGGIINAESEKWGDVTALSVSAVFTMERVPAAAAAATFLTAGDVTAASRLLASHEGPYLAPTLIALPEGGSSESRIVADASGWVVLPLESSFAVAQVAGVMIGADWVAVNTTSFWQNTGTNSLHLVVPVGSNTVQVYLPGSVLAGTFQVIRNP